MPKRAPEGSRQQSASGGGAYQRKGAQVYLYASCRRAFVYHDVDAVILHGGVKILLHQRREAVNLVDEQDIVRLQAGQYAGKVARLVEYRAGSYLEAHAQFVGNDVAQRGLSQSRRAVQQHVVQCFASQSGCLYKNAQVVHHLVLPAEVLEVQGAQGVLEVTLLSGRLLVAYIKFFLFHAMLLFLLPSCPKAFSLSGAQAFGSVRAKITKTDEPCCFLY